MRAGQYWQSVKPYSGSVGLSYLAAQRRDCEETDAVNALASLSVGVLSNKRYNTQTFARTHTTMTEIHTASLCVSHLPIVVSPSVPDEPMEHDSDSM